MDTEKILTKHLESDAVSLERDKKAFAELVKNGLGDKINNYETYNKPDPKIGFLFMQWVKKIIRNL